MTQCEECIKTMPTQQGEISVDMCEMLGTCTCNHSKKHK